MIEYYIDGSTKEQMIGVGIVKVNEFGFIEKHHYNVEHINPSSNLAEGYSLEKTFELIERNDLNKNEIIDIYTDNRNLYNALTYNANVEFNRSNFFIKMESNHYFLHIRNIYVDLISRYSKSPIYFCEKTKRARPLIKVFYQDEAVHRQYLQDAHKLSRNYIKEEEAKIELKALKEKDKWVIKNPNDVVAENKRPLIALAEALKQLQAQNKQIQVCDTIGTLLKNTNKNHLSNEAMKSAYNIIEKHKLLV